MSVGFSVALWCFVPGFTAGFGSRKEDLVDKKGDSKSIFEKVRFFIKNIPAEFLPAQYEERTCSAFMKVVDPEHSGSIIGEAGDQIGRGGRCSIYVVDEAAHVADQKSVDAALSQNTNCQVDISTPNGNGNEFYRKRMRFDKTDKIFVFDWKDDPRKDQAWYDKQVENQDEATVAQEIDRDYNASAEDSFIPAKWVKSAIDAHILLGFEPEGLRVTSFDPADIGDAKASVDRYGSVLMDARQLKKGDITQAIPWVLESADIFRADIFSFDADGMGAPSMKLAFKQRSAQRFEVNPYYGSGEVENPDDLYKIPGKKESEISKTNKDTFENYRAQSATYLRDRFRLTHEAVERAKAGKIINADPNYLISISSKCEELMQLEAELSRPKRVYSNNGKIMVESKKAMKARGVDSPNLFDSTVIAYAAKKEVKKARKKMVFREHSVKDYQIGY